MFALLLFGKKRCVWGGGGGGVGEIKTIGTFEASTKSGYIEQLVQLQAHSPTQDTVL